MSMHMCPCMCVCVYCCNFMILWCIVHLPIWGQIKFLLLLLLLTFKNKFDPPHLGDFRGLSIVINLSRRTAPKFGTHVRIDTLTLIFFYPPHAGGVRGLSIVEHLSRQTAPKFGTHVRIDTLTLKKIWPTPSQGGLGGYLLLNIFRDRPRPNLARMCG